MAFKLTNFYHDSFYVLNNLLLVHVLLTAAQGSSGILQVLVPSTTSFSEFVNCSNESGVDVGSGFAIDVFKSALPIILLPEGMRNWTDVNYTCYQVGLSGTYDDMINELQSTKSSLAYDVVVADITISAARLQNASFTQSYLDSGIVLLTSAKDVHYGGIFGLFFRPFTLGAWLIMIGSLSITVVSVSFIETIQRQDTLRQFLYRCIIGTGTVFITESRRNLALRTCIVAFIVFTLVVGASYTASLSSMLTVYKLSSDIKSIEDVKSKNLSIGCRPESIVRDYLVRIQGITNPVDLSKEGFADALSSHNVSAIAEESPYVSSFLADQPASKCKFLVSQKLTTEGLGFAFRNESLSSAFSVAILNLSESGQLQRLRDGWKLSDFQCSSQIQSTQLELGSSSGLFVLLIPFQAIAIIWMIVLWVRSRNAEAAEAAEHERLDDMDEYWEQSRRGYKRRLSSIRRRTAI